MSETYTRADYDRERVTAERVLAIVLTVSDAAGGIKTSTRWIRATQLFTRLSVTLFSFIRLLPENTITRDREPFWDWPSVAALARNIIETYHAFYYLTDPTLSDEDVQFRINLMHLHHNAEKYRLYREWGAPAEVLTDFETGLPKDRERLRGNSVFTALSEKHQESLLKGKRAMHLQHEQINAKLPFMGRFFRPIYSLFCNQVHSTPFAFQTQSNERGRGDENDTERFYIILAIQVVVKYVTAAVLDMARIFPEEIACGCEVEVEKAQAVYRKGDVSANGR